MKRWVACTTMEGPFLFTAADSEGGALDNFRAALRDRLTMSRPLPENKVWAEKMDVPETPQDRPDLSWDSVTKGYR